MPSVSLKLPFLALLVLVGCEQPAQSQQFDEVPPPQRVTPPPEPSAVTDGIYNSRQTAITRAVEQVAPAVVSVNAIAVRQVRVRDPFAGDPFFEYFFGRRRDRVREQRVQGVGSGFVISPDGYVVTNDHVAGSATELTISFPDGRELPARLVGTDPETDIALLKVEPEEPLPYLAFSASEDVFVGEWAVALGNPFGLFEAAEPTVTVGVVSAVGRDLAVDEGRVFRDMIQTDAAINRGNSGGPLVNALGEVIGVNTFIYSRTGGSVGIGFAVPAWRVQRIVEELRETGRVARPAAPGLTVRALTPRAVKLLGLPVDEGLLVVSVDAGSPADAAGLQPYDIVLGIDGEAVADIATANAIFRSHRPGDTVTLRVLRGEAEREVPLTLSGSS
ncbi:MAG: trypsin-like peptidase domain-containing protein [Rhodothermales bacterium]|nr:trypsin-like peptidase domain-containing protein [Rhodothermales bacterium]